MKTTEMQAAERLFNTTDTPVSEIARAAGVDVSTVYSWAKKHGWNTDRVKDLEKLRFDAAVLFIKHGYSVKAIHEQTGVSMPTIAKWRKEGRWIELRPDMEVMNEYKAATMYIRDQMPVAEICSRLSVPEATVNMWIYLNGWDTPRNLAQVQSAVAEITDAFCTYFKSLLPGMAVSIEFAQQEFIKSISARK
ncbi:MAG TPA: hypothetical protein VHE59_10470 [Mucilaginibacter sp.]|nr:hypothetical protein [Mucilaginibacter sp.]